MSDSHLTNDAPAMPLARQIAAEAQSYLDREDDLGLLLGQHLQGLARQASSYSLLYPETDLDIERFRELREQERAAIRDAACPSTTLIVPAGSVVHVRSGRS